jgi:hypothetical protein
MSVIPLQKLLFLMECCPVLNVKPDAYVHCVWPLHVMFEKSGRKPEQLFPGLDPYCVECQWESDAKLTC